MDKMKKKLLSEIVRKYDAHATCFFDDLLAVKLNDKWGFINDKGEKIIPLVYDNVYNFQDGLALVRLNDKWGIISKNNEIVISFKYDSITILSHIDGIFRFTVQINHKYKIIDLEEKLITSCDYDNIELLIGSKNLAVVMLGQKFGHINIITGEEIVPPIYDLLWVGRDVYTVQMNGKWGIISKNNEILVSCKYDTMSEIHFNGSVFKATLFNKTFLIYVEDGKIAAEFELKYDNIVEFNIYNKLFIVKKGNKFGAIDIYGQESISCIYDHVYTNENDTISLLLNNDESIIMIDKDDKSFIRFHKIAEEIGSRDDSLYYAKYKDTYILSTGCFKGNLDEFEKAVKSEHAEYMLYYKEYMEIINILKSTL